MRLTIPQKLKKALAALLDNSYHQYMQNPDRKLISFLKAVHSRKKMSSNILIDILFFSSNKYRYVFNKRDIFNALVLFEEKDNTQFINSSAKTLADLFYPTSFEGNVGPVINATVLPHIKTGLYINPFTQQPIEVHISQDEKDMNKCIKYSTKYLFSGVGEYSKIVINYDDITDITASMKLPDSLANHRAIAQEYIIYHELSHDSHYQNYRMYKDATKMNVDLPKKTKVLQEIESDISSVLYVIKDRKLDISDAFELLNGVLNFRCSITVKNAPDTAVRCLTEESIHYHVTQPSLLVLSRIINDQGVGFIHNMSTLEITTIAYHIAELVYDESFLTKQYKSLLPKNPDEFRLELLDTQIEAVSAFYLLSFYGDSLLEFMNADIEIRRNKFEDMVDQLINKLYSDKENIVKNSLLFRVLVAYQFAVVATPEKIQKIYLNEDIGKISAMVYDNFLERLVFKKTIEVEHNRDSIRI
jgi:hypothetical protein